MNDQFQTRTAPMRAALDAEMRRVLQYPDQTDAFWGMLHYHMGWVDAELQPEQVYAGKQIRPLLVMLACQAAGGDWRQAVPAAAAIELVHNFSLIHDDIEDHSPTRRGRETVWKIWGMEQAINAGDALFSLSHLGMSALLERGVPAQTVVMALRRFDETCVHLTQGQQADMAFESRDIVTVDEYLAMITGKTAVLIQLCTELGARIAGQDEATIEHYAQFGRNLGLAFQMQDDILGIWGQESRIGKSASTDITTRKKTLPVLYGLQESASLRALYLQEETGEQFVASAISLLEAAGAREFAAEKANTYSNNAIEHLQAAQPGKEGGRALFALTNFLLQRDY
jgi:geranylgeranyl diphosphate synthase type I